ncbi:hypothetical protein L6164_034181 [Bauhinia variegata]|uniref:Uncharacterized protein n=1 Tax=Bauhinia variegata TaxID=167791 RepID=A0ACB9KU36_BAUVA|nr:hypothetical protein L6164_034181 [Bauhinia variegata]
MIHQKIESEEATYGSHAKSEGTSIPEDPVSSEPEKNGRWEPKIKLKKLRSIRIYRVSSIGSSTRSAKYRSLASPMASSVDTENSERRNPIEMSDASPHYMKGTSSSHAKESFQSSERMLPRKGLTRMSTLKLKRTMSRKLSGGSELKRKLKSSRSFKVGTVKGLRRRSPSDTQPYLTNAGNKSQRVITRRLSLRPVRILTKMPTFKSKKASMEKTPQSPDSSLLNATCSSTLKDSHFHDHIEQHQDESGSQGVSDTKKVCPYTYCSLHGRHRENLPPLKRFVSMRRRLLKTQKSMKMESTRSKHSGNTKKGTQKSRTVHNEDHANKIAHAGRSHFEKVKKLAGDSPVRTRDSSAYTLTEDRTSGGDDKEKKFFTDNAEVLLGETSRPHISFDGFPYIETSRNGKKEVACEKNDETTTSILIDDQLETSDQEIPPLKDHGLCAKRSLVTDDSAAAGNKKLGEGIFQETQEERNSTQKLANPESAEGNLNAYDLTNATDQASTESKGLHTNDLVESTPTNLVMPSASDVETTEEARQSKNKYMEPDYKTPKMSSPGTETKPACSTDSTYKMQARDHKYIRMQYLIYKHAVLNSTGKGEEKLTSDRGHGEVQGQDDSAFTGENSSPQDCCDTDQVINDETENVIELVQRAFDEILLPETEDLSSDDHLKTRGHITSDQELLEKSQGKLGESSTLTSRESSKEEAWPKVNNSSSHEQERTVHRMGNKPDKQVPKNWSNLRKLILLKRFVKALEKVSNLKPSKHRHLSLGANLEAEKVNLRHQTEAGKKNHEEWMLDFALQKVISKLAPAQRQRVALLVEAFETIQPYQDTGNSPRSYATVATLANSVQALCDPSDHSKEETGHKTDYDYSAQLLHDKASYSDNKIQEYANNPSNDPMTEQQNPVLLKQRSLDFTSQAVKDAPVSVAVDEEWKEKQSLASGYSKGKNNSSFDDIVYSEEIKGSRLCNKDFSMLNDVVCICEEDAPTNLTGNKVPQDFNSNNEIPNGESELRGRDFESKNLINADGEHLSTSKSLIIKGFLRSLGSNLVSSASPSELLDESRARKDGKESIIETKQDTGTVEGFPPLEESEAPTSTVIEPVQLEKQNHTRLWYLVYKHMASGIAGKSDSKLPVDGADQQESGNDVITLENTAVMKEGMHIKKHNAADPEVQLHQIEAIKMVEEAIDAILPDDQDSSPDGQSPADNVNLTNFEQPNKTDRVFSEEQKQKEERVTSGNGVTQEGEEAETVFKEGKKPDKQLSRNWSNLKKVILLRKFIKALENVRKFNPRGPKYLPLESDPEAEKIELRHQDMEERKGAEEWMLDYALRQVVAKLTPARKRKVELLVEAFETVIPTIKS